MTKKVLKDIFDEKINKNDIYNNVITKKKNYFYGSLKYCAIVFILLVVVLFSFKNNEFKDEKRDNIYINKISDI